MTDKIDREKIIAEVCIKHLKDNGIVLNFKGALRDTIDLTLASVVREIDAIERANKGGYAECLDVDINPVDIEDTEIFTVRDLLDNIFFDLRKSLGLGKALKHD
jgi:ACT domain-containing protein